MDPAGHTPLPDRVTEWFPLVPRTRPPCRALPLRISEVRDLAHAAGHGPDHSRLSWAAEAHNKAALILSDCGLPERAHQLCWRQFTIFHAATPLTATTAKLALQPIVNLGRLLTRRGHGARAYQTFQNAYYGVTTPTTTAIDGTPVDFSRLLDRAEERHELRTFLWTMLLADGTRALTSAGRWVDAVHHLERHKGIGNRMLDGRQVAILAHCATGDHDAALDLLHHSLTPEPWEQAIAAYLRALCLHISGRPTPSAISTMVNQYLQLDPKAGHPVFRTRLGLSVFDLAAGPNGTGARDVAARIARDAGAAADANIAWDIQAHTTYHQSMNQTDQKTLANIIESAGYRRATMPANLLDDLTRSVKTSEARLTQLLDQNPGT